MRVHYLFELWWQTFGSKYEEKVGLRATNKAVARCAFEAGMKVGKRAATSTGKEEA